jgi:hypothetical protein
LKRFQVRLHADERIILAQSNMDTPRTALERHIADYGEAAACETIIVWQMGPLGLTPESVPDPDNHPQCAEQDQIRAELQQSQEEYFTVIATVHNELVDDKYLPLMDEKEEQQQQTRELAATMTVAAIGIFVPLSLTDAAIDVATLGLGRLLRLGRSADDIASVVRAGDSSLLDRVANQTDDIVDRVLTVRGMRTMDELLPNGKVPGTKDGVFNSWFDDLTPDELDMLWRNEDIKRAISRRIREPRAEGWHEWCMVCRAPTFKKWNVSMDEIKRFRTRTEDLEWTHPIEPRLYNFP